MKSLSCCCARATCSPRVRAAYLAMELTAWFVIVPLILASLLTGLVQSLGTTWGLFRHYWVLAKLVLTVFVTIVLMLQLGADRLHGGRSGRRDVGQRRSSRREDIPR
ncbi:MAG TPA: hypothetical protein VE078_20565, partial [Thermoanaerobaculia bacterium]|nr:hypothetical protein [Thermoanaerobaculia bacterium]